MSKSVAPIQYEPGDAVLYQINGDISATVKAEIVRQPDPWHVDVAWWSTVTRTPRCFIDRGVVVRFVKPIIEGGIRS